MCVYLFYDKLVLEKDSEIGKEKTSMSTTITMPVINIQIFSTFFYKKRHLVFYDSSIIILFSRGKILLWEIPNMSGFTTNVEFGYWLHSGKVLYGRPDGAPKIKLYFYSF